MSNTNGPRVLLSFGKGGGLVLNSARAWRNADAKRPGMHSHAKRGNEVANEWPTLEPSPKAGLTVADIDWVLPHQANMRINRMVADQL